MRNLTPRVLFRRYGLNSAASGINSPIADVNQVAARVEPLLALIVWLVEAKNPSDGIRAANRCSACAAIRWPRHRSSPSGRPYVRVYRLILVRF
jgi:hypothetical protein